MTEPTFMPPADVLRWILEAGEYIINLRAFLITVTCLAWAVLGAMLREFPVARYETSYESALRRQANHDRWKIFVPAFIVGLVGAWLLLKGPI